MKKIGKKSLKKILPRIIHIVYKMIRLIIGLIRSLFYKERYCIKRGYIHRNIARFYDDTECTDEYQKEVYLEVKKIMEKNSFNSVVDFGCGSGYKLINYLGDFDTIGIDIKPIYEFLVKKYPQKNWLDVDKIGEYKLKTDVIVCADVIEHVLDPDELINTIKRIVNVKYIFISTPERDLARGKFDWGPPGTHSHLREWNLNELNRYISNHFNIIEHKVVNFSQKTQLVICKPKLDTYKV